MNCYSARRRHSSALFVLVLSVLAVVATSQFLTTQAAALFTVNSLGDTLDVNPGNGICADANGACTLRAALQEANSLAGDDTINFSVTGTINLTGTLPSINSNVNISGPGSSQLTVRRDTGGDYRIFQTGGNSSISGLTITNGKTPDSVGSATAPSGGGILQTGGSLTLRDVVITGNTTGNGGTNLNSFGGTGGFGGGISASGTLTMTDCVISNNTTGNGGPGGSFGGSGGRGAGIYFWPGTLTLNNVTITGNRTGNSGAPTAAFSGHGGGMWLGTDSEVSGPATNVNMSHVKITNNSTGDNVTTGDSGSGGGIYVADGLITLTDSEISNNHTGNANPSSFSGTAGGGGGILNVGSLTIRNSLISGNTTGVSSPGANSFNHTGGGGINNQFSLTLINTTVSGNTTGAGPSIGGGIFSSVAVTMFNCTVTKNSTPNGYGNGVTASAGNVVLGNTIIAGNGSGADNTDLNNPLFASPPFNSQGFNLIGNADGATGFNFAGDQVGTGAAPINAQLGPLSNNGGPTWTHALLNSSPALDAGSNGLARDPNNPLTTDQRGSPRIVDSPDVDTTATVDIGAFEFSPGFQSIANQTTNEDTPVTVSFNAGDGGPGISSLAATSSNQAIVPDANLVFSDAGSFRTLRITPAANQSGITTISLTINLSGGGVITDDFQLTVFPINDAPTFTKGTNQTVNEDAGAQTITNWATTIDAGPNEVQTVTFNVTNNTNPALFSVGPAVSETGTLTFTPAANAFGSADISVVLKDNGGTSNGGQDTSVAQTFTINVTGVNDAPTFTKGADQTITEDAGFQFMSNWATGISPGPNETTQTVSFIVTNNTNPGLFQTQPTVGSTGVLTYIPAFNANGTADITIVAKDNGGTTNGGFDTSAAQTFTITVTAVNDAPVNTVPFFPQTNQQTPLLFSAANFNAISVSDVDAGNDSIRVSLTAADGTLSLGSTTGLVFVTGDGTDDATMSFTGTITAINSALNGLTFKPNNGFSGTTTIQVTSDDQGHNGAGGALSATSTIQVIVSSGGRFSFNISNYGVNENGGTATITVLRAGGSAGTATVNYATSNGTATGGTSCTTGVDYLSTSGTLTWNNGDTSVRQFVVAICNDGSNEEDETINLTLSNAGGTGSLGVQPTSTLTIGNDDAPVLLREEGTASAIALDLVTQTRDPFSLSNPFNLSTDQRRRVSLFVWRLGLLVTDTPDSVTVTATDSEGRIYNLPVETLSPVLTVQDVTQVIVRLPDNVIGAPRDLRVKVTLRGPSSNEAIIKIAAP